MQPHAKVDNDVRSARADGCLASVTEACVRLIKVLHIVELHVLTLHTDLLWCAARAAARVRLEAPQRIQAAYMHTARARQGFRLFECTTGALNAGSVL